MIHLHLIIYSANVSSSSGRANIKIISLAPILYSFDYLPKYTSCYKRILLELKLLRLFSGKRGEIIPQRLSASERR